MSCLATLHGVIALERAGLFGADLTTEDASTEDASIEDGAIDVGAVYARAVDMVIHLLENP
jgi:hypothetical protein